MRSCGEKGLGQRMVIATGQSLAKPANHAGRSNRREQMEALIPANAIAPADVGLSGQPSRATPLGIARGDARTVQRLVQTMLRFHLVHQEQTEGHDHIAMLLRHSIELLTVGQGWERRSQVAQCIAVVGAFARKLRPLSKHRQRYHLATRQRGLRTGTMFFMEAYGLAKVIDHHVQCSQKGIKVHHQRAPFPYELDRQAHCRL